MSHSSPKNRKPCAVVIGLDGMVGVQTARLLARRGVPVIAVAKDPKHNCCKTNVCERIIFTDTSTDDLVRTLEILGPQLDEKAVLFPCTDMSVLAVSRNRARLEKCFYVILPAADVIEMMIDKVSFYTYAQTYGFPIPRTFFIRTRADAENAGNELRYPSVLKPPTSSIPGWEKEKKLKGYLVHSPEELLSVYDHLQGLSEILIAQEWVAGPITNLYSCNCYYGAEGTPLVTFIARKIRQWPPETGESSLGAECRNDVVLKESIRLFSSVGFRGLGYLEMKQDERTEEHFIIEPNVGRPTGRSAIAEAGGVELIYTMYCDALGWPLPPNRVQHYGNVKWISLRRDIQSSLYYWRRGELTLKEWWRSVRGRKAYAFFSWSDPLPFWSDLTRALRIYPTPSERKKRRYTKPLT